MISARAIAWQQLVFRLLSSGSRKADLKSFCAARLHIGIQELLKLAYTYVWQIKFLCMYTSNTSLGLARQLMPLHACLLAGCNTAQMTAQSAACPA